MSGPPTRATVAGSRYLTLRKLARKQGRPTAELLQLYALEGFLSRLVHSPHRDRFVLKGGMLLAAFDLRRPTKDIDLLALHIDNDEASVRDLIRDIATREINDGLSFHPNAITSAVIRDEDDYSGVRIRLEASLSTARLILQVDISVGDPVVPGPVRTTLPVLLDGTALDVLAYPKAMVMAEKLVTALERGKANTRWRDFADLYLLITNHDPSALVVALRAVARHRGVVPRALSVALAGMADTAQPRWKIWWRKQGFEGRVPSSFADVLTAIGTCVDGLLLEAGSLE